MSQPGLEIETSQRNGSTVVSVNGEIDLSTASQLERELAEHVATQLIVDLTRVDFMDSTGIGVLVRTSRQVATEGGSLSVIAASGPVRRVLEVSGLDGVLPIFDSLDDAVSA